MRGKKALLAEIIATLDGESVQAVAQKLELSPETVKKYLSELGAGMVSLSEGRIYLLSKEVTDAATFSPIQSRVHVLRPSDEHSTLGLRLEPLYILSGDPFQAEGHNTWTKDALSQLEEYALEEEQAILDRIAREGSAGRGERRG